MRFLVVPVNDEGREAIRLEQAFRVPFRERIVFNKLYKKYLEGENLVLEYKNKRASLLVPPVKIEEQLHNTMAENGATRDDYILRTEE